MKTSALLALFIGMIFSANCMLTGCEQRPYENSSLKGCYAMNNDIFHQFWFDGVSEFEDIYFTWESGTVSYAGQYRVSDKELYLEYYSYDPETHTLILYRDGFTLDDTPYYYIGEQCG